ncbi:hypothetical protein QTI66_26010 [Variovorax sp. J22R133]|uniref:hypothetical protein n=1 Tax=Variovorax brevis TaxID=3053503 RepID=UPI0025774958|nr:hypothetical protein [Variovorax sp. J22R133]MDM0115632.1 hypothetical protein [Variovorax sp. J22R133]
MLKARQHRPAVQGWIKNEEGSGIDRDGRRHHGLFEEGRSTGSEARRGKRTGGGTRGSCIGTRRSACCIGAGRGGQCAEGTVRGRRPEEAGMPVMPAFLQKRLTTGSGRFCKKSFEKFEVVECPVGPGTRFGESQCKFEILKESKNG